jgi:hypothetical protein
MPGFSPRAMPDRDWQGARVVGIGIADFVGDEEDDDGEQVKQKFFHYRFERAWEPPAIRDAYFAMIPPLDQALLARVARSRSSMLNIDLHCHSNVSDGVLPPAEVVARAAANGVQALALTDHDDVAGIAAAQAAADAAGLTLIPGVEISVSWGGQTVHIVGLRIDPRHPELAAGLADIRLGRIERARRMGTISRVRHRGRLSRAI